MKKYLTLILALVVLSCSWQRQQENSIESIRLLYSNTLYDRMKALQCDEMVYAPPTYDTMFVFENGDCIIDNAGIFDTTINDQIVLKEIKRELPLTTSDGNYGIDARMKCYIRYSDHTTDSLCTDRTATYGYYNGKPVQITNRLAYLLRRSCGFYRCFETKQLASFEELNDTTFVREKVTSCSGEMY